MTFNEFKINFLKILLFLIFFLVISLIVEITFFNKDFFYIENNGKELTLDYYWIRHLALFLLLIMSFILQKKRLKVANIKPYAAFFALLLNIIPAISYLSKYLILFLVFLLFLYIKSDFYLRNYKRLLQKNLYLIVFFAVLFIFFFPMFFEEGYVYDPLAAYMNLPGYRLSRVSGLRETIGSASDLFDAFLPQTLYTYQSIREGIFPLWRYNKGLGISLYKQSYHPENLIEFVVKPSESVTLRVLVKLFFSMIGMYWLLRALKIKEISSMMGGIAYAFSGFIIGWLHAPQSSISYHIPFLFFFLIRYLSTKNSKFLFYFAISSILIVYSGFIPIAGYSFYGVGLFLIIFFLLDRRKIFEKVKEGIKISIYWILSIIVMVFNFLPLYYAAFIEKTLDISYRQVGKVIPLHTNFFPNILFPFFYGWKITPEIRPYVSSIIILFLISGFFAFMLKFLKFEAGFVEKEKYYVVFLFVLLPFILAMFGIFPFYQISCKLPILRSSGLGRLQSVTCFLFVILGVKGLDLLIQSYKKILDFSRRKKMLFLSIAEPLLLTSVFMAIASLISKQGSFYRRTYPSFIFIAIVILAFQLSIFFKRKPLFFLVLLLPIVTSEIIIQNQRYIPVNKRIHFITEIETPLLSFVKRHSKRYEGLLVFDANYNVNGTLGNYGLRELVVHQFFLPDERALVVDTFSTKSFRSPTAPILMSQYTDFSSSLIQLMGSKFLIFSSKFKGDNLPEYYKLVYSNLDGKVFENVLYKKNKGIFFGQPKVYRPQDKKEIIRKIKSMDYSKYVYIESGQEFNLNFKENMECFIRIGEYTPNEVVYRYRANSDGIITFPEAFHKDWSVTVNGEKAKVLKTNLIFRGVAVKEGQGEIVFTFHVSQRFKVLLLIGFVSLLALVSLYLVPEKLKK